MSAQFGNTADQWTDEFGTPTYQQYRTIISMTNTPNHEYNVPTKGTTDWHLPLNENFEQLDNAVAVRDLESKLAEYTPKAGAKFEATDSGTIYYGDGSSWTLASRNVKSLSTRELINGPSEGVSQSVSSCLSSGYIVGVDHHHGIKSVNPVEFETDDAAFQAVVDWIESNGIGGSIYASARRPDGNELVIENTVAMDESLQVPINWHFKDHATRQGSSAGSSITTTIDDGSPMFDICGNILEGHMIVGIEFHGKSWNLKDNNASVVRFRFVGNSRFELGHIRRSGGDAIVMDSGCMDNSIDNTAIFPTDQTNARGIVFENSENVQNVGADHAIGPFFKMDGDFDVGVANSGGHTRIRIGGKIEGASGLANITNTGRGAILVTPYCMLGNSHNGAHGLYTNSHYTVFAPSMLNMIDGDGIHVGPDAAVVLISPSIRFNGINGDSIHFESDTDGVVPYENSIKGTVTYPSAPWQKLHYIDGWQKYRSGTSTIKAGSDTSLTNWGGRFGTEIKINWWVESNPSSNIELIEKRGVNYNDGQQSIVLEETTGNSDVDVGYVIYRRGHSENLS